MIIKTIIQIIHSNRTSQKDYANLIDGSRHTVITPPAGEQSNFQDGGVWVIGALGKPIKVLFKELTVLHTVVPVITRGKPKNTIKRNRWK